MDCVICYDGNQEMIKLDGCDHYFCKECFRETYRSKIEDQQ